MGGRAGGGASGGMGSRSRGGGGPQPMAVVKGQPGYKAAQDMTKAIQDIASRTKYNSFGHEMGQDRLSRFLDAVAAKGGFGGDVAKTVSSTIKSNSFTVAKVSDKQAWAIAKSAVEKGIAGPYDKKYDFFSK
ncbi:MAG: hypothetical protein IKK92_13105 [Prevotella sp.]|nr:hypothetical protein [Prevotella sp.]